MLINVYCTQRDLAPLEFVHTLVSRRDRPDEQLSEQLREQIDLILADGNREMTQTLYHVMRHLGRVQHHLELEVDGFETEGFTDWLRAANAVCSVTPGEMVDPWGKVLVSAEDGSAEEGAEVPFLPDAYHRKATSDQWLREHGILVPPTLPPVVSEAEVVLRSPEEVARRSLGLFVVALRAESLASENELSAEDIKSRLPLGIESLSPREASFLAEDNPAEQEVIDFSWRYEALFTLQWSVGLTDKLPLPTSICDVPQVARVMLDTDYSKQVAEAKLRPAAEILNALDLHYRLHWATRQAVLNDLTPPAGLDPGVTTQRHHALNWLVQFEQADWDDVETPT